MSILAPFWLLSILAKSLDAECEWVAFSHWPRAGRHMRIIDFSVVCGRAKTIWHITYYSSRKDHADGYQCELIHVDFYWISSNIYMLCAAIMQGFGVWGLGFGVWGLGFGVWGLSGGFCFCKH